MKFRALIVLFFLPVVVFGQAPVKYAISFENRDHHEAKVTVIFSEVPEGPLQIQMSRSSPGRYALHEFAKNVYAVKAGDGKGKELQIVKVAPHIWQINGHRGTVVLDYTIFGDLCDGTYLAIDNTHAHMNIPATFMWASSLAQRTIEIKFDTPADWQIATQLAPTGKPNVFAAPNLDYFMDSPTEASAHDLHRWPVTSGDTTYTIRLALHHGGTNEESTAYAEMCKRVVQEEMAIFGALPHFDYGTYTFIADYLPYVDGDGMEHRNSTICTSTRTLAKDAVRNLGTIAHEFFHCWNVERLRPASLQPFDFSRENMSGELWFAEGFTSYYDGLVLNRAGITTLDRFAEDIAGLLNAVVIRPGREYASPVEMSMKAPFTDAGVSNDPKNLTNTFISYYPYGATIGLALDLTLRQKFDGLTLDDFMRAVWLAHGINERPYNNEDLRQILGTVTGNQDFADMFFNRYVYGRELPDFEELLRAAGLLLRVARPEEAWLDPTGLEFVEGKITILDVTQKGSSLYKAGLDREDVILKIDGVTFSEEDTLKKFLDAHKPGDEVEIVFEKRGEERRVQVVLQQNPKREVVRFESCDMPVSSAQEAFRSAWLGSKSDLDPDSLHRYCPKCRRAFPFRFEYCQYDGEELMLMLKPVGE